MMGRRAGLASPRRPAAAGDTQSPRPASPPRRARACV